METPRATSVLTPPAPAPAAPSAPEISLPSKIPARLTSALALLLEAHDYAQDLGQSRWDFAVELPDLRQLALSNSDLRWLVGKGFIDHAREITLHGEEGRTFRRSPSLVFGRRMCFVLTDNGVACSERLRNAHQTVLERSPAFHKPLGLRFADAKPPAAVKTIPKWDRDRQQLRLGGAVVKQFKVPAANQEAILAAFEEENWPPRIDDPIAPSGDQDPKRRLHDTINSLNRNQKRPLIRFLGDGSGQGVRWELVDAS